MGGVSCSADAENMTIMKGYPDEPRHLQTPFLTGFASVFALK